MVGYVPYQISTLISGSTSILDGPGQEDTMSTACPQRFRRCNKGEPGLSDDCG